MARPRSAAAENAFRLARRTFIAGERIDMQRLAAALGVDRTTLYRWVGNRDQLLEDVLGSLAASTLRTISDAVADRHGAEKIVKAASLYAEALMSSEYYRLFLLRDPERALRLVSTRASSLQRQLVMYFELLLSEEMEAGRIRHPLPVADLAYVIVRVLESFVYSDLITGETPDATKVVAAVSALLSHQPQELGDPV